MAGLWCAVGLMLFVFGFFFASWPPGLLLILAGTWMGCMFLTAIIERRG